MKTLLTLFSTGRNELETEIEKATTPEQVVKLVQNRLDGLEKSYISSLNVSQVRLASFFLETLRQSISTLTAANETKISQPNPQQINQQTSKFPSNKSILKGLQGLLSIGILGSLFSLTQQTAGAWTDILLMSVLVGLEVVLQLEKDKPANNTNYPQLMEASRPIVQIDSKVLLDNLGDALNTIDLAVASAQEAKKTSDFSGIEEVPELVNLLQRLMGASFLDNPYMAIELTKLVPQILVNEGISSLIYRPNDPQSGREYFDFEPNIDRSAKDYVTITPALLKGDKLLRRGRVIEPVNLEKKD
jgi:hypothetical protein